MSKKDLPILKSVEIFNDFFDDGYLCEMSNLSQKKYKLPVAIWVSASKKGKKGYSRVKVARSYAQKTDMTDTFVLAFNQDSAEFVFLLDVNSKKKNTERIGEIKKRDVDYIVSFIVKYKSLFIRFWKQEITEDQFKDTLKKAVQINNPDIDIIEE